MARSRGSRFPRTTSQRRKNAWVAGVGSNQAGQSVSATGKAGVSLGAGINVDGLTLVRTRGEFQMYLESASSAGAGFIGAVGLAVVTDQAFNVGITAIPGPVTESNFDGWLYHRFFSVIAGGIIDGGAAADHDQVNAMSAAVRVEIDSKAMRKVKEGETIVGIMEFTEIGTAVARFFMDSRMLFKLA